MFLLPNGTYFTPDNQLDYINFVKDNNAYSYEQFDLKFNRPDIIIEQLGFADTTMINAYKAAYQKRLKKLGFTETMLQNNFNIPEITITNLANIPATSDSSYILIDLSFEDSLQSIDRINVWINDVAIYGANGISWRDKNAKKDSTTINIPLIKGKNKVQFSALNQTGAESYKASFDIQCNQGKDKPDLYLITIGESEFLQTDYNLKYAAKDAHDMANLFASSKAYQNVFTKTLTNQQVTKEEILALQTFLEKATINDQVMIFIAGHGVLDQNLDYYFATYDMDFENPTSTGLAYEDLEGLLDGISPLQKTLIIDACHAGEIDKDEILMATTLVEDNENIQFRAAGNSIAPKLGMQNTSELTKTLFTDLRKGTGATVISSASGLEFAMEGDDWNNGLFTFCFINGIQSGAADLDKNGEIWLSEIQEYVGKQVNILSKGQQQPTSRIENQTVNFRIW